MPSPLIETSNSLVNFGGYYPRGFGPKHDEWYGRDLLEVASELVEEYEKEHGQAITSPPPAREQPTFPDLGWIGQVLLLPVAALHPFGQSTFGLVAAFHHFG